MEILLASSSEVRAQMLRNVGLTVEIHPARIDEDAIRQSLLAQGATSRDIADALAEMKAAKVSARVPGAMTLGADQILDLKGRIFAKPETPEQAVEQLSTLSGQAHRLLSAAVVCQNGAPIWRHVGEVRLTMHRLSEAFIADYVARNWDTIRHCVGCYAYEGEGPRLFSRVEGDYFSILGLPLSPLLNWLHIRGDYTT